MYANTYMYVYIYVSHNIATYFTSVGYIVEGQYSLKIEKFIPVCSEKKIKKAIKNKGLQFDFLTSLGSNAQNLQIINDNLLG